MVLTFLDVTYEKLAGLSFSLGANELRVLRLSSLEDKAAVMNLAVGERNPEAGLIQLQGVPLVAGAPGSIGWIPVHGGLVSNLKTWENVTLPLWYHGKYRRAWAEEAAQRWLALLGLPNGEWQHFMASPSGKLKPVERKLAGLLRGLLLRPPLLVIDADLFDEVPRAMRDSWVAALELCVSEAEGCALVVADKETALPWETIGWKT